VGWRPDDKSGTEPWRPVHVTALKGLIALVVTPLLDRLMHHGHLLKFQGKSWRLKESAERLAKSAHSA
jgi:hypothetical protein